MGKMVNYNGKMAPASEVGIDESSEPWQTYTLADGTVVKTKAVMMDVVRIDNEYTDTGDPIYQFQFQQIITVVAPDSLKRKTQ
ncbi:hypothetical protein [Terriglobus tenax]|uniref:hypothetical protein n=1 Tax=Terriglobus tenax TaxID=1111115 RepID=UPI0021E0F7BB|nr:hypothetical protein [Terriglobus tenax]